MGRPLLRTPELADRFIVEAARLLEAEGIDAVTTRATASAADSSLAALNALFGSKDGLMNAVALHGFDELLTHLDGAEISDDPTASLITLCVAYRSFTTSRPRLVGHMYSRPHASFDPSAVDLDTATQIRRHFTNRVAKLLCCRRSTAAVVDTSTGLVALLEGLSSQDRGGILGSTPATANRRWQTAISIYLAGARASDG